VGSHRAARTFIVALAAGVSGCGGGDDSGPSRPAFIAQADAICKQGNDKLRRDADRFFGGAANPSASEEREYVAKIFVPNLESQLAKLRKLSAPKGDENTVRAIWDASAAGLAEIKARHGPSGPPPAGFTKAQRLAAGYGFKVCGRT
jgi:hypothetical protein